MFTISVFVTVQTGKDTYRRIARTTQLPFVPRVGDFLCSDAWGLTFEDEGAEVKSVGIGLDDGLIVVWIDDDNTTWKDIDAVPWKDADDMIAACYAGFTEC